MACVLAAVSASRRAVAQLTEIVELKDGSLYQGQLIEKVEGDRIVIQLATGEIKTLPWDQVVRAVEAPAAGASSSAPPRPAPPTSEPPPSTPSTDGAIVGDTSHIVTGWPDPHTPAAEAPAPPPGQRLFLGFVTSLPQFGSPRGILGVMTEYRPLRWLGLEVGGAYDGPAEVAEGDLGWSVDETLHVGSTIGLGLGVSQHYGGIGSGVAQLGHAELDSDFDLQGMVSSPMTMRLAIGAATMFNGADHPGACGFFNLAGHGSTDENGNPTDTSCLFIYVDVEFFFRIHLGGTSQSSP